MSSKYRGVEGFLSRSAGKKIPSTENYKIKATRNDVFQNAPGMVANPWSKKHS
jgi:hypothetical protein